MVTITRIIGDEVWKESCRGASKWRQVCVLSVNGNFLVSMEISFNTWKFLSVDGNFFQYMEEWEVSLDRWKFLLLAWILQRILQIELPATIQLSHQIPVLKYLFNSSSLVPKLLSWPEYATVLIISGISSILGKVGKLVQHRGSNNIKFSWAGYLSKIQFSKYQYNWQQSPRTDQILFTWSEFGSGGGTSLSLVGYSLALVCPFSLIMLALHNFF